MLAKKLMNMFQSQLLDLYCPLQDIHQANRLITELNNVPRVEETTLIT